MDPSSYVFPQSFDPGLQYFDSDVYRRADCACSLKMTSFDPNDKERSLRASNSVFFLLNKYFHSVASDTVVEVVRRTLPKYPFFSNDHELNCEREDMRKRVFNIVRSFYRDDFTRFEDHLRSFSFQKPAQDLIFGHREGSVIDSIAMEALRLAETPGIVSLEEDEVRVGRPMVVKVDGSCFGKLVVFDTEHACGIGVKTVQEVRGMVLFSLSSLPLPFSPRAALESLLEKEGAISVDAPR